MKLSIFSLLVILANIELLSAQTNATYIAHVDHPDAGHIGFGLHVSDTNNVYLTRFAGGNRTEPIPYGTCAKCVFRPNRPPIPILAGH
jgi:hypothetical protein